MNCIYKLAITAIIVCGIYYLTNHFNNKCIAKPMSSYSYIIIGAGTTGCVLAARLSEQKENNVLLVEAGSYFNSFSKMPFLAPLFQRSSYDWSYQTVPQKWSSRGLHNEQQFYPRGKGLGGTGQINFLVHGLLEPLDLENWEQLGAYNIKDGITKKYTYFDQNYNVKSCDLNEHMFCLFHDCLANSKKIKLESTSMPLSKLLQNAIQKLNISALKFIPSISTTVEGRRHSTFNSHAKPAFERSNLHVLCNAEVTKILFNGEAAVAINVIIDEKETYTISATKEIILAAGSINSPKLLMLSGIGDAEDLQKLNVTLVSHLPGVGKNLHDHLNMPIYVSIEKSISVTLDKLMKLKEIFKYMFHYEGLLSKSLIAGIAYMQRQFNIALFAMGSTDETIFRSIANYKKDVFSAIFPEHINTSKEGVVFLTSCAQPKSRGFLKLNNTNPKGSPVIDPQYLKNFADIECMKKAMKFTHKIVTGNHFASIGSRMHLPYFSNCKEHNRSIADDKYLECVLREAAFTGYHPAGTCKMGNDALAVTDHKFRVHGVQKLRIVDASVLPTPVSSFPNSILVAMAEYASKLILNNNYKWS